MSWIEDAIDVVWRLVVTAAFLYGLFTMPEWLPAILEAL